MRDGIEALEGRVLGVSELVERLPIIDENRHFFRIAFLDHLDAVCTDQPAVVPLLQGQCYVAGPGLDVTTNVGLMPDSLGIWYLWTDGGSVRVSTTAPPQFLDRIPGDESSSRLEAALRSSTLSLF